MVNGISQFKIPFSSQPSSRVPMQSLSLNQYVSLSKEEALARSLGCLGFSFRFFNIQYLYTLAEGIFILAGSLHTPLETSSLKFIYSESEERN